MTRQLPPVDDEVFEALQRLAEPLVDDVNSVLRRLLGIDGSGAVGRLASTARELDAELKAKERSPTPRSAARLRGRTKSKRGSSRPRAESGSLLPEREYEEPLLRALVARGGSAPASELIEDVGATLDHRLTPADREVLDSGLVRWKNRTQFVRLKLVQAGLIKKGSPRGIWEITPAGRERVESLGSNE